MFCSFFRNICLSISLLFSSFGSLFHKPKPVKPVCSLTKEQRDTSEFIIKKEILTDAIKTYTLEPEIIKELTLKEKIKIQQAEVKKLKRQRKAEKAQKKQEEYNQWRKDQKRVMDEIDTKIAQTPKKLEVYGTWHLTEEQMDAMIDKKSQLGIKNKSFEEENAIFV